MRRRKNADRKIKTCAIAITTAIVNNGQGGPE
jgi:hypothetical protein